MTTLKRTITKIPVVEDVRGNLGFIQKDVLPFEFKRVYYLLMCQHCFREVILILNKMLFDCFEW
jgi:hypothetical protein